MTHLSRPQIVMTSIVCSRLLVHIREMSGTVVVGSNIPKSLNHGNGQRNFSGIDFALGVRTTASVE